VRAAGDYFAMMDYNVRMLTEAFRAAETTSSPRAT
jgi:hypothetical protein